MTKAEGNTEGKGTGRTAGDHRTLGGALLALTLLAAAGSGCAALGLTQPTARVRPIANPFGTVAQDQENSTVILRTKKGDRSVEVEFPGTAGSMTDLVVPVSPAFAEDGRAPSSISGSGIVDAQYRDHAPTMTDHAITQKLPQGNPQDNWKRQQIENELGLVPTEDPAPQSNTSYLAALDYVKQLFQDRRYEAALLEVDQMIRQYPTDPKLFKMRGTLLERLGYTDLAVKSWEQALKFDPSNEPLKRFIARKNQTRQMRGLASP